MSSVTLHFQRPLTDALPLPRAGFEIVHEHLLRVAAKGEQPGGARVAHSRYPSVGRRLMLHLARVIDTIGATTAETDIVTGAAIQVVVAATSQNTIVPTLAADSI